MRAIKILGILLLVWVAIVAIFESMLGYFQPEGGGDTVVITTFDADGTGHDRVLSGLDSDGQFYVAVNHWPRAWYRRALENPAVQITRGEETLDYTAVLVTGEEDDRVRAEHPIPIVARILMGFAPRHFLRLDPAAG
ncbi:MAG: DUF385 domain-containing protein [Gammaproteobacteria bacterium]|nr:DUF385 domain-containing protein [Gammaproteobacteria bacterium]